MDMFLVSGPELIVAGKKPGLFPFSLVFPPSPGVQSPMRASISNFYFPTQEPTSQPDAYPRELLSRSSRSFKVCQ